LFQQEVGTIEAGPVCNCDSENVRNLADNNTEISSEISCSDNAAEDIIAEDLNQMLENNDNVHMDQFLPENLPEEEMTLEEEARIIAQKILDDVLRSIPPSLEASPVKVQDLETLPVVEVSPEADESAKTIEVETPEAPPSQNEEETKFLGSGVSDTTSLNFEEAPNCLENEVRKHFNSSTVVTASTSSVYLPSHSTIVKMHVPILYC